MIREIIWIIVVCGALALVYWAVDALGTPDPVNRVVKVVAVVLALILIVSIVLGMLGMSTGINVG